MPREFSLVIVHLPSTTAQSEPASAAAPACLSALAQRQRALGDELRLTLLRVLRQSSYAVSELVEIVGMTQSALSHHLKLLHEAGLLARRREGNTIYYRRGSQAANGALTAVFAELDQLPLEPAVRARRDQVLEQRRSISQRFFDEHATAFREQQTRISQADVYTAVVLQLADRLCLEHNRAMEIGPGDGELSSSLATRFTQVSAVDHSERMLAHSAAALASHSNVRFHQQPFETLPASGDQDLVVAAMVLHHLPDPALFFEQATAVMAPGAALIVAELCSHDQQWAQSACGDLWLGFEDTDLIHWAAAAGLTLQVSEFLAQRNGFRIQVHGFSRRELAGAVTDS
ncbi:MAG: metalloregulator ArsR/SmtB family transcription factor [Pseudomonadales bacterium]